MARILRISPEVLLNVDQKMSILTGQSGVIESISNENDIIVDRTLSELGLARSSAAEEVYEALVQRLVDTDGHLYKYLGRPDLSKMSNVCGKLCESILQVFTPPKGLFIKKEKAAELLDKCKPDSLLNFFGYQNSQELIDKEGFSSVVSALRFTQSAEWMHEFFDTSYKDLKPEDFEEREVEIKVLEEKWLEVAEKFLEKKYHNVSHLKEYGVIFIIPLKIDTPGETIRMYSLLLHYLHEVPFYSDLFRKFINESEFINKFQSLLRGDVSKDKAPDGGRNVWRIVQRYLAKDDENDFRLFEPHVNPESDHWLRVGEDLTRVSRMFKRDVEGPGLNYWTGLDFIGDFFKNKNGEEELVSFDLIDLIMSIVKKGDIKYLYHQQEALWNKIFSEYMGREKMNRLIEDNIIDGFIRL